MENVEYSNEEEEQFQRLWDGITNVLIASYMYTSVKLKEHNPYVKTLGVEKSEEEAFQNLLDSLQAIAPYLQALTKDILEEEQVL